MEGTNPYEKKYKQLNLLGKGNYGKVYKVRLNNGKEGKEATYFVAKKMFLQGMSEEDIQSAYGQIAILERLNDEIKKNKVPFLVGYEEFFRIQNELIIIMEYCEEGDLSTYIKQLKRNNQRLDEKIIGYWFTQLLFGIRVLHSKNILHRDLKSANIFLTKNYSLKIGDFGISKVLEHSSAITCIGTPLYLSPEVCNNQPYGYSSDLWALGCILYEMCTLKYPFEASNMIVLAKKIVMDKVEPIPNFYDARLNNIVMGMFEKQPKKRITGEEIIRTEYFRKVAQNFLQDQGRIRELAIPIDLDSPQKNQSQDTWKTIQSMGNCTSKQDRELTAKPDRQLTTKERLALKKIEEAKKREQELNAHSAAEYKANQTIVKTAKDRNNGGFMQTEKAKGEMMVLNTNKAMSEVRSKKKPRESIMEKAQDIDLEAIFNTIHNVQVKDVDHEFQEVKPLPGSSSYVPIPKSQQEKTLKRPQNEEIQEDIEEDLEEYYDQDFETYEEPTSAQKVEIKQQKEDIASYFENELGVATVQKKTMVQQALKPLSSSTLGEVIKAKEGECIGLVGEKRFKELKIRLMDGKINPGNLIKDKRYNLEDRKVIYLVEEILELKAR